MTSRLAFPALAMSCAALVGASAAACGDLKVASQDVTDAALDGGGGDDAGSDALHADADAAEASLVDATDAGADASAIDAGFRGPGPHGSLPSGYCCNDDSECRYRHCIDGVASGGTGKMCLDECFTPEFCTRPDITFTCVQPGAGQRGMCEPPGGFACIPAAQFVRGSLPVGACCNAGSASTNDGTAGSACEGNQCAATGSGPLVCTNRCSSQADCPGGFTCTLFGTTNACVPTSASYTCN